MKMIDGRTVYPLRQSHLLPVIKLINYNFEWTIPGLFFFIFVFSV